MALDKKLAQKLYGMTQLYGRLRATKNDDFRVRMENENEL